MDPSTEHEIAGIGILKDSVISISYQYLHGMLTDIETLNWFLQHKISLNSFTRIPSLNNGFVPYSI